MDAYRSQQQPEAPVFEQAPRALTGGLGERRRRGRSSWLVVGIVGVSIVLVASLWSLLKPPRTAQTSLHATPPATAPTTTLVQPTTTTAPAPRGVTLVLHYLGTSWTKVTADGKVLFRGMGTASDRRTFTAKRAIEVTLGAPWEVQVKVNGQSVVPGNSGQIWNRSFTVDSVSRNATSSTRTSIG